MKLFDYVIGGILFIVAPILQETPATVWVMLGALAGAYAVLRWF